MVVRASGQSPQAFQKGVSGRVLYPAQKAWGSQASLLQQPLWITHSLIGFSFLSASLSPPFTRVSQDQLSHYLCPNLLQLCFQGHMN